MTKCCRHIPDKFLVVPVWAIEYFVFELAKAFDIVIKVTVSFGCEFYAKFFLSMSHIRCRDWRFETKAVTNFVSKIVNALSGIFRCRHEVHLLSELSSYGKISARLTVIEGLL